MRIIINIVVIVESGLAIVESRLGQEQYLNDPYITIVIFNDYDNN